MGLWKRICKALAPSSVTWTPEFPLFGAGVNLLCPNCGEEMHILESRDLSGSYGHYPFIFQHRCCHHCRNSWLIRADVKVSRRKNDE